MDASSHHLPSWVRDAAGMPLAFAQVREDPLIDRWVVERCAAETAAGFDVIQIASGGCTAAVLATMPQVARLRLVDPNPAQLALTRLKLELVKHHDPRARMAILGHAAMAADARAAGLRQIFGVLALDEDCLGPMATVARLGPDHAGRYEMVFAALRQCLAPMASAVEELLTLNDVAEQRRRSAPESALGHALDHAFSKAMALENLVQLFGARATGNAVMPFHQHFMARLRHVLATLPAATNPYLWQVLLGIHPLLHPVPWLTQPVQPRLADIAWTLGTMDVALQSITAPVHIVHLSNILDWLSPEEARHTLSLAWRALRPGGWVVIRQLNSSLDIPSLHSGFVWSSAEAAMLHHHDRSFFYRTLHLGRKP